MDQVPLTGRVIFSDWHGALSRDPFWTSIRNSATHPLHDQVEAGMAVIFDPARSIASEWMKGLLSSEQIITQMGIQLRGRLRHDFLARRLDLDCARMKVNVALFEVLRVIRAEAMVVIATDNMDCFARAFSHARSRRRRPGQARETLADWAAICDDIVCSSQAGALKSEDPQAFFGPWLDMHGVGFSDALLIDDRQDNCDAFTSQGGAAIQWNMGTGNISALTDRLRQWLDRESSATPVSAAGGVPAAS
jgi:FMN phosphatase YigB (HAD superfamily)